jgi:hypothetical protein
MLLSTVGVWCLGPAVSMFGQASAFYQIAIQFFLHFQFNGWFLIAVIAIFFHILQIEDSKLFRTFFIILLASTILTLALPIQWFAPHKLLLCVNGVGVVLQIIALFVFLKLIKPKLTQVIKQESKLLLYLYSFAIFCFIIKTFFQLFSISPEFSEAVYTHRNLVIGFIHLLMLGVITGFLMAFILKSKYVVYTNTLKTGIYSLLLGFVLTEVLFLIQGCKFYLGSGLLPNYYFGLFLSSIFLPLGIVLFTINILKHKTHES